MRPSWEQFSWLRHVWSTLPAPTVEASIIWNNIFKWMVAQSVWNNCFRVTNHHSVSPGELLSSRPKSVSRSFGNLADVQRGKHLNDNCRPCLYAFILQFSSRSTCRKQRGSLLRWPLNTSISPQFMVVASWTWECPSKKCTTMKTSPLFATPRAESIIWSLPTLYPLTQRTSLTAPWQDPKKER